MPRFPSLIEQSAQRLDSRRFVVRLAGVPLPTIRCSVDIWLSKVDGGPPADQTLIRQVVMDGESNTVDFFYQDAQALFTRYGKLWVVVSYSGTRLASGAVRLG